MKKVDRDETAKSFLPEDQEIELLKFKKIQEDMIKEEQKKMKDQN